MVRRRPAALKLLHPSLLDGDQAYRDFLSQAQQAAELVHPHIAWVWESGEAEAGFFLVERFVNGPALASRLAQTGTLPWEQARQVVDQIAQALEFAYSKGWVHGRVTPHNILLGPDQTAVLSDYGLQRALRSSQISTILQFSTYDAQYLPPEVLQGKPVSPAADQYALACTLLEMLAGKNPFAAPSLAEIEQKHLIPLVEPLFPPENAPWQIGRVLEQALSPEPTERFKNAGELVAALNKSTSPGAIDPGELARREAQVEAWRMAEQQRRQQDEESARLAALEQARREIQEQAHREVEALELLEAELPESAASEETPPPAAARRERRRPPRPRSWPVWALAAITLVALASYLMDKRLSMGGLAQPTPTATSVVQPVVKGTDPGVTPTTTVIASSTPTQAFTPSASVKPSVTLTRTSTATKKPTATPSVTPQPSATYTPSITSTRTKPEKPDKKP
jgi:serine/threonine-protein kinase